MGGGAKENLKNNWTDLFVKKNNDAMAGNSKLLAMGGIELVKFKWYRVFIGL